MSTRPSSECFQIIFEQLHGQRGVSRAAPAIALDAADKSLILYFTNIILSLKFRQSIASSVLPYCVAGRSHEEVMMEAGLHVEVRYDEITVTLPFTSYTVTYYKPAKSPQLLAKRFTNKDDPKAVMTSGEFLALAWRVANKKARELGWIV